MRNLFVALATIVMLALPGAAIAGNQAAKTKTAKGYSHEMCALEASTGQCDKNLTPGIYAIVDAYDSVTFILNNVDDTASTSVCEIYGVSVYDSAIESTDDITAFGGDKINSTDLQDSQEKIQFNNINYKYMYVICTTADITSTVTMQGTIGPSRVGR
jgi:hypothetical protein